MTSLLRIESIAPRRRWMYYSNVDKLIHTAMSLAHTRWVEKNGIQFPERGVTECGQWTRESQVFGWFLVDQSDTSVNCILCATGACDRGAVMRAARKDAEFMLAYGMPADKVLGRYAFDDATLTLALKRYR